MAFTSVLVPIIGMSIPIVAILSGSIKSWIKLKERQMELAATTAGEQAAQYAAKIERLEAHVAVLNRIVTEKGTHLADEIEALRDPAERLPPPQKLN